MNDKRFELWLKLGQFLIGTVVLGLATTAVNWQIQTRQVEIKELEQLGKFVEYALDENLTVRQRFADYFATVSRTDDFRTRWEIYKKKLDDELQRVLDKAKEIERKQEEEVAEKDRLQQQLQANQAEIEQLRASLNEAQSTSIAVREKLQQEIAKQEAAIRAAQTAVLKRDERLAVLQSNLQSTQTELSYTRRGELVQDQVKSGWVYLGEFDTKAKIWKTRYWTMGLKTDPMSLTDKTLQVSAAAVNVRNEGNPWAPVLDALNRNATVKVEHIEEWGRTGYFWAQVSY